MAEFFGRLRRPSSTSSVKGMLIVPGIWPERVPDRGSRRNKAQALSDDRCDRYLTVTNFLDGAQTRCWSAALGLIAWVESPRHASAGQAPSSANVPPKVILLVIRDFKV